MRKRTKIIAIVVGAILLVSIIVGGVVVLAADPTPTQTAKPQDVFLEKLAAKLNIPVDQLQSAIDSAAKETKTQFLQERLDALVAAGKLTQPQADDYLTWWQSQPDLPNGTGLPGLNNPRGRIGPGMMGRGGGCPGYGLQNQAANSGI